MSFTFAKLGKWPQKIFLKSVYITISFNIQSDFVSIISTLYVSALIGHLQVLTVLYLFMLTYCNVLGVLYSRWNFIALQKSIHYS
jgi:hypothetical protein